MSPILRIVVAWLAFAAGVVVAFYAMIALALSCFDCANPPPPWLLLAPWLLPAGLLVLALWASGFHRWIARLFRADDRRDRR